MPRLIPHTQKLSPARDQTFSRWHSGRAVRDGSDATRFAFIGFRPGEDVQRRCTHCGLTGRGLALPGAPEGSLRLDVRTGKGTA